MQQKMEHLNQVIQANGLPETLVRKTLTTNSSSPPAASIPQQGDELKILCTPYIKGHTHQGSKQEDWEGLCPSGSEACLQTSEDSQERPNASEEQDTTA